MPRPLLSRPQEQTKSETLLSTVRPQTSKQQTTEMEKMKLDRLLRKPRSKKYMDAVHRLDAGGHTHNQTQVNDIINAIRDEFPEMEICGVLIGVISKCYLGKPYEVHTLDLTGGIIEHYQAGQCLTDGMERARGLVIHGGYEFVEVYADCCRCVSANGTVSVIRI